MTNAFEYRLREGGYLTHSLPHFYAQPGSLVEYCTCNIVSDMSAYLSSAIHANSAQLIALSPLQVDEPKKHHLLLDNFRSHDIEALFLIFYHPDST